MNIHLSYFLTAIAETLILYLVLSYIENRSPHVHSDHVYSILITNFIVSYSSFYLLPLISNL